MRFFRTTVVAKLGLAGAALAMAAVLGASHDKPAAAQSPVEPERVPGEIILAFVPGTSETELAAFYADHADDGVAEKEDLAPSSAYRGRPMRVVSVPEASTDSLLAKLSADPRVHVAEPNYVIRLIATPNDPSYSSLWGLHNTGQTGGTPDADIDAPEAWDSATGSASTIAFVIDTGADLDHPDLQANLWVNPGEIAGNGLDDDGNGYIDDVHGIDAILNNGNPEAQNFHGTHVSGTMGAVGNNATGVVGVNWIARIGQCKFLNPSGTTADAIQCFHYVNDLKAQRAQDIRVTNNSWGGGGFSSLLQDAMQGLDQPGMAPILHAVAAGNNNGNNDVSPFYPASYPIANILSVAATDHNDVYAGFSNYGATSVDIAAPGVSVLSTSLAGGYTYASGTSMASPHVAGCADLVFSASPGLTSAEVKSLILDSGEALPLQAKKTLTNDRLNCARALEALPSDLEADLSIAKTASPSSVLAGSPLAYSVTATNLGPDDLATGLTITDTLPSSARFVSAVPNASGSCPVQPAVGSIGGTVVCTWTGPVPNGASRAVTINVTVCGDVGCTSLVNRAEVGPNGGQAIVDPNEANDGVTLMTPVQAQADVSVSKTDSPDPVLAGQTLVYNVSVRNAGPSTATEVVLTDVLDDNVSFVSATVTPAGPACVHAGGVVTCALGTLGAPGAVECFAAAVEEYQIEITVDVSDETPCSPSQCPGSEAFGAQPLSNVASVSDGNCLSDPNPANNTDTELTQVLAGSDVLIDPPAVEKHADSPALVVDGGASAHAGAESASTDAGPALRVAQAGGEDCIAAGDELLVTQVFSNTGPLAYTRQRDNKGPEFEATHPRQVEGLVGTCTVLAGGGTCSGTEQRVEWNGEIPVGGRVVLQYRVRVRGGQKAGQPIEFTGKVIYDEYNVGVNTATRSASSEIALDCVPIVNPNAQLGGQVHLPVLNFIGQDELCETWIEVQNLGCDFAKASLVVWGEWGFCPPQAAGPLKVECTGLLKPGSAWNLLGAQIPSGANSGMLFRWTAKQLTEIGVDLGFDDVVADYMCQELFFGIVGDADDYRRFKKAYNEGLEFRGVPLDLAAGDGLLAVDVHRTCESDLTPGVEVTSKYNGIAGTHLGMYDPVFGGYGYYVPLVYADKAGFNTLMYIQNGGLECSSIEVWFQEQDACLRAMICDIATLAPGETYPLDANDCVGPDFQGSAWIRTSQPMGVAVDIVGRDLLMTYVGEPSEINYSFDPDLAVFSGGNQVAFAPLVYSEYQGWDSGIQVQNLSAVTAAKVKVYFMDRAGGVITTLVDWVCPRGSQTFYLPVIASLPGSWVGSARVESQEWISPGGPLVNAPNVVAIATLIAYEDAGRTAATEAVAYNLLPEHKIYDWQIGFRTGGDLEAGVGLIAIPSLLKDVGGTGLTSELAIANVVPKPGFTDLAIYIHDQNGLLDYLCQKLNEKQVEYIDLATWGYVSPGFKGSAVISAQFWEHDVFDDRGRFVRNLVGLGAVAIERSGAVLGTDVPGDEAAGARGIPFANVFGDDDDAFEYCLSGPAPICPGTPRVRRDDECPAEVTFGCENCPQNIPVTGTSGPMNPAFVEVDILDGCTIVDVDVTLDLNHTWIGDLDVDVTSPEGTASEMFNSICGNADNIQVILDDDSAISISTVCPPLGFQRLRTQSGMGLTVFDGEEAAGTWRLDINDLVGGDQGVLNDWQVTVRTR